MLWDLGLHVPVNCCTPVSTTLAEEHPVRKACCAEDGTDRDCTCVSLMMQAVAFSSAE